MRRTFGAKISDFCTWRSVEGLAKGGGGGGKGEGEQNKGERKGRTGTHCPSCLIEETVQPRLLRKQALSAFGDPLYNREELVVDFRR